MSFVQTHIAVFPVVVPLLAAVAILLMHPAGLKIERAISLASLLLLAAVAAYGLVTVDDGTIAVYRLGDWPAPYGIVLVLDRLSAIMLALTAVVALAALAHAIGGGDTQGRHFHALFQLQLMGLNGAFLTGDLFNLFVFFEILLLASYALLAHGGGKERTRAALTYTVLNLVGSAIFLVALALVYGTLGTLNIADIANVLPAVPDADVVLVRVAMVLLLSVFLLKAAVFPMSFWLPRTYPAASPAVMVLFVLMTKVGIYALLRVSTLNVDISPATSDLAEPWLTALAIATIAIGSIGALAAQRFSVVVANLVLISSGTLLAAAAVNEVEASAAALYYLLHSTLVAAGLFLIVDAIARSRGALQDVIGRGAPIANPAVTGLAYFILTIAIAGVPPLSGFLGKLMVMQSVFSQSLAYAVWGALLISGLTVALVLARAGSLFFWQTRTTAGDAAPFDERAASAPELGLIALVAASLMLAVAAAPVSAYVYSAADQLHARAPYIAAVLGTPPDVRRSTRP